MKKRVAAGLLAAVCAIAAFGAGCGEKVCEACCEDCARNHDPYHACMFRREAGL